MAKTIIIADNNSALLLAHNLRMLGDEVVLIDTEDHMNPHNLRSLVHLNLVPARGNVVAGFRRFEKNTGKNILAAQTNAEPITFQNNQPTPFVGFGESKSSAVYPLSQYNFSAFHELLEEWPQILHDIRTESDLKILPFSDLTTLKTTNDRVEAIVINGNQEISGDRFIFHCDPRKLLTLLPSTELSSRFRSRLNRSRIWCRLGLQFHHATTHLDSNALLFIPATNVDDPPLVGRFELRTMNDAPPLMTSTWETYIESEEIDNPEEITTLIKALKRRIRRFFPNFEERPKEYLTLDLLGAGDFSWVNETNEISELFSNFFVSSPLLSSEPGVAQCVDAVEAAMVKLETSVSLTPNTPSILSSNPL